MNCNNCSNIPWEGWILKSLSWYVMYPFTEQLTWIQNCTCLLRNGQCYSALWLTHSWHCCIKSSVTDQFTVRFGHGNHPNITSHSFYVQGAIKNSVYRDNSHSLNNMKGTVTNFIWSTSCNELAQVLANQIKWTDAWRHTHAGHFQHLL